MNTDYQKEEQKERDWIAGIKPGDQVIIDGSAMMGIRLGTVERLTKTQIIIKGVGKYNKRGHAIGEHNHSLLRSPTQERVDAVRTKKLRNHFKHYDWHLLDLEALLKVLEALYEVSS